jgi:hypothetical protein
MPITFLGIARQISSTQFDITQYYNWGTSTYAPLLENDLLVIFGVRAGTVSTVNVAGWNVLFGGPIRRTPGGTRNVGIGMWWKFRSSLDTTVTVPDMDPLNPSGRYMIYAFRGVDTASPFDITPDAVAHVISGAAVPNPPAVTPLTVGAMVCYWGCNWSDSGSVNLLWDSPIVGAVAQIESTYSFKYTYLPRLPHRFGHFPNWTSGVVDGRMSSVYGDASIVPALVLRPAGAGGNIKVWNGSAWVAKPAKVWNGSAWVTKPVKVWNGTTWVTTKY